MIADTINNASMYYNLSPQIASALKFLETSDLESLTLGRHEIDGDKCYALVQEYDTKPVDDALWEAHRRYTDVQYVVAGVERMGYANLDKLSVAREYDEGGDYVLLMGQGDMLVFEAGAFAIFSPQDAHMPQVAFDEPQAVRKIVVKVRAEQ